MTDQASQPMRRMAEPMLLSKAIEGELEDLFAGRPEPQKSICRREYLQSKIETRQRQGKDVPDRLFVLQAQLQERISNHTNDE